MAVLPRGVILLAIAAGAAAACTIGAFSGRATADGRPMLWKNRDVANPDQEVHHFTDARYRYVANVYAGESLKVWAGINERGFAIVNSDAHNIGGRDQLDDGVVMKLALGNCATLEDFAGLMDSLNEVGRDKAGNFGVFDSTGAVAMFEAANTFYHRFDADSTGIILRANYAYAGDSNRQVGRNRHDRALELIGRELAERELAVPFITRFLARDLGQVGFDPYPLPFEGRLGDLPFGFLPTDTTIGRAVTRSVEVMVGPRPGGPASDGMMWIMLGSPFASIALPLWVQGGPVPELLDGPGTARLCDEAQALDRHLRSAPGRPGLINTLSLRRALDFFAPLESLVFARVDSLERECGPAGPDSAAAAALTGQYADELAGLYARFWRQFDWSARTNLAEQAASATATVARGVLSLPVPAGATRLVVYDAAGRAALRAGVAGRSRIELNVGGLVPGGYHLVFDQAPDRASRYRFVRLPD
ncbi:MAG: hypothetical protein R6X12_07085 [bacterium]